MERGHTPTQEELSFRAERQESLQALEDFSIPEYHPPIYKEQSVEKDLEIIKRLTNQAELIKGLSIEQRTKILELEDTCGEEFKSLTPETKIALSELERTGQEIKFGEFEKVSGKNLGTGEVIYSTTSGVLPDQVLSWSNLAFLRKTEYLPRQSEDKIIMDNSYDATKEKDIEERLFRMSLHWCLNHTVTSHTLGNWEDKPFTIIVPGTEMIKANGNPDNLLSVDTFWEKSLEIPSAAVIICEPGFTAEDFPEGVKILHLQENESSATVISLALKIMGYTEIEGGSHYSRTEGLDDAVRELQLRAGIESSELHTSQDSLARDIETLFHPSIGNSDVHNALARILVRWDQVNADLREQVTTMIQSDLLTIEKNSELPLAVLFLNQILVPEYLSEKSEKPEHDGVGHRKDIPIETRREIFEIIPRTVWQEYFKWWIENTSRGYKEEEKGKIRERVLKLMGKDYDISWISF